MFIAAMGIGRVRKYSGGKGQAYNQPHVIQVNAGRIGSWFWLGAHTGLRPVDLHWSLT